MQEKFKVGSQLWTDSMARDTEAALIAGEMRDAFANFRRLAIRSPGPSLAQF